MVGEGGPLLCRPIDKARLEAGNGIAQVEYIQDLIDQGAKSLRESHVLHLHELAILGIYGCGGRYRDAGIMVKIHNSPHTIPEPAFVRSRVREAIDWINEHKSKRSALERAAYALWRFNWIHPFAGGNGRTSRAIAYLITCMDNEAMLPGKPNMPSQMYEHRDEYINALRAVDACQLAAVGDVADLSAMVAFLRRMLTMQLANAIDRLATP